MALYHSLALLLAGCLIVYLAANDIGFEGVHTYATLVHLASVGAWLGTTLWVTFFSGILLFKHLDRYTFGDVQSHIFPVYFSFSFLLVALAAASWLHLAGPSMGDSSAQAFALAALCLVLNLLVLGPAVTVVMRKRHKLEKEEGSSGTPSPQLRSVRARFGMLHGLSSLANLVVFLAAVYHVYVLSSRLTLI